MPVMYCRRPFAADYCTSLSTTTRVDDSLPNAGLCDTVDNFDAPVIALVGSPGLINGSIVAYGMISEPFTCHGG